MDVHVPTRHPVEMETRIRRASAEWPLGIYLVQIYSAGPGGLRFTVDVEPRYLAEGLLTGALRGDLLGGRVSVAAPHVPGTATAMGPAVWGGDAFQLTPQMIAHTAEEAAPIGVSLMTVTPDGRWADLVRRASDNWSATPHGQHAPRCHGSTSVEVLRALDDAIATVYPSAQENPDAP